ncbi:MAG TPA: hypothetical protein VKT72_06995 [Candidatus Baltobacteraceae bacterium]|nr:hypothetical protein [Candidatus Baltobacteraceae bacterium]
MSEKPPPDFAMLRAVEILAQMHERVRKSPNTPPAPIDRPVVLQSERITLAVAKTKRSDVERELGVAFSYPARGWHTYATNESGTRCLLSLFYKNGILVAAELYVPRGANTPNLESRSFGGFRLEPGSVRVGFHANTVAQPFTPAVGGPGPVVYDQAFEARFPGGVSYAMASKGVIERLTVYADLGKDAA